MKALDSKLQGLRQQIEAAPWLKWAGLVIVVLAGAIALQAVDAYRVQKQKDSIAAEQALRKTLALKGQEAWLSREQSAKQLHDSLLAQLPQVATPGMAEAALQNWLRKITTNLDAQNVVIRLNRSAPVEDMPDILRVNAALNGNFTPGQSLAVLRQIESAPNLIAVETLVLQSDTGNNTLHLTVNAFYRTTQGANQ